MASALLLDVLDFDFASACTLGIHRSLDTIIIIIVVVTVLQLVSLHLLERVFLHVLVR